MKTYFQKKIFCNFKKLLIASIVSGQVRTYRSKTCPLIFCKDQEEEKFFSASEEQFPENV